VSSPAPTDSTAEPVETVPPWWRRLGDTIVSIVVVPFEEVGTVARLLFEAIFWGIRPPYRFGLFIESMEFVGVGSIFIVSLTAFFVGAVLGLQLVTALRVFSAENTAGAIIGIGLAREIGPVFAALMVSSRAGSAMTTELGSMRVTSQIDALVTMAVNPVQYLVVPRLIAGVTMVPILTALFCIVATFGAYVVAVGRMGLDPGVFMDRLRWLVDWRDMRQGLVKAAVFGFTVCLIACRQGYFASGGAAGVGRATNRSVVHNAIAILALDYVLTSIILERRL
jgi:phospholipid/cholesterol/gamma-HCH transport system permease protein